MGCESVTENVKLVTPATLSTSALSIRDARYLLIQC